MILALFLRPRHEISKQVNPTPLRGSHLMAVGQQLPDTRENLSEINVWQQEKMWEKLLPMCKMEIGRMREAQRVIDEIFDVDEASISLLVSKPRTPKAQKEEKQAKFDLNLEDEVGKEEFPPYAVNCGKGFDIMTLEELSSTDVECEWAVRKKDVEKCYAVVPLQDFCHVEQTTDIVYTISDEQRSRFRRSLLSACPASAAALHVRGRRHANASFDVPTTSFQTEDALLNKILARDLIWEEQKLEALPEELKSYYKDNVQVSSPKAYNLAKSVQQQSSTWLAERSHRITGSVCYELYTYTKNKAPNWEKKIKTMLSQEFQNTAMVYGTETETVAKEQYMLKCGMTIYNFGLLVVPTIPWLGFSPDGIAVDGDSVVLLEIKCPIVGKTTPADGFVQNLPYITVNEQSDLCLKKKTQVLRPSATWHAINRCRQVSFCCVCVL
ncbi:uncharacterized protein LOC129230183 [Uloborus diversus]|uniref:uncharacterized protein LOC129230183 n=1 Tax=Uloborus diversus TaxID=327109 RepID=UPI002409C8F7|nr:uncharacterized protein LOC129230183 [Uloborus diversus]